MLTPIMEVQVKKLLEEADNYNRIVARSEQHLAPNDVTKELK